MASYEGTEWTGDHTDHSQSMPPGMAQMDMAKSVCVTSVDIINCGLFSGVAPCHFPDVLTF
jgi:hypothetical protein